MLDESLAILVAAWSGESIRRAARFDGFFPANLEHPDQLAEVVGTLTELRHGVMASYDIAVALPLGVDPEPYAKAGATWWLPEFEPGVRLDTVRGVLRATAQRPKETITLFDYDSELARYHRRLRAALDIRPGDRVLDIGCGTGQTTRDAARVASPGTALGIDVSGPMLVRARQQAETEGLHNIGFVQADAQTHAFPPEHFTLATSRFGTMFFSDPSAAFANIGRALRPGARFVQLVWQAADRQEWHTAIRTALSPGHASSTPAPAAVDPFTLADPDVVAGLLTAAGFTAVDLVDVREPVCYGPDADRARAAVLQLWMAKVLVADLDPASAERARDRLYATLDAHDTGNGVWFDSRAWLVIARRR